MVDQCRFSDPGPGNDCCANCSGVGFTAPSKEDAPDSAAPGRALRSMQIGQNSIAPENLLPQLGQVRWGSALMLLIALQPQSEPNATPRSAEAARNRPGRSLTNCLSRSTSQLGVALILALQITFRNKIPSVACPAALPPQALPRLINEKGRRKPPVFPTFASLYQSEKSALDVLAPSPPLLLHPASQCA
jgi:hypothetical protein